MRDRAVQARIWREVSDATYGAFLDFPNGVSIEVKSPTWRKLINMLQMLDLDTSLLFEDAISDGLGILERALR